MINQQQVMRPLFEFSGACGGCGETPYVKLISQLFGDRAVIANATGCSSIYGGNMPTTPWAKDANGRGPAWANSLFEDNAEFGFGFRMAIDKQKEFAGELLKKLETKIGADLVGALLGASQKTEAEIQAQRERVADLKKKLSGLSSDPDVAQLLSLADTLVKKSVWIMGGDGWAYDIGFGGLDHVIASGKNVNIRARYRGVLEHRRSDVEVDAALRGCEIRDGREIDREEESRFDRDDLRQCLRRIDRDGRERPAGAEGDPGGRSL